MVACSDEAGLGSSWEVNIYSARVLGQAQAAAELEEGSKSPT